MITKNSTKSMLMELLQGIKLYVHWTGLQNKIIQRSAMLTKPIIFLLRYFLGNFVITRRLMFKPHWWIQYYQRSCNFLFSKEREKADTQSVNMHRCAVMCKKIGTLALVCTALAVKLNIYNMVEKILRRIFIILWLISTLVYCPFYVVFYEQKWIKQSGFTEDDQMLW